MYFCTEGMALLIESPEYEWEIAVGVAAVGLMIGVAAPVSLAMLLTPELLARARGADLDAFRTSWRERRFGIWLWGRWDDEHWATRFAHRSLRDQTQQEAFDSLSIVGTDYDQVG